MFYHLFFSSAITLNFWFYSKKLITIFEYARWKSIKIVFKIGSWMKNFLYCFKWSTFYRSFVDNYELSIKIYSWKRNTTANEYLKRMNIFGHFGKAIPNIPQILTEIMTYTKPFSTNNLKPNVSHKFDHFFLNHFKQLWVKFVKHFLKILWQIHSQNYVRWWIIQF